MAAYGFSPKMTESECVAELFRMYKELRNNTTMETQNKAGFSEVSGTGLRKNLRGF